MIIGGFQRRGTIVVAARSAATTKPDPLPPRSSA